MFPWKVREVIVKHISDLDELAGQLDLLGLNEYELVEGFDRGNCFTKHMTLSRLFFLFNQI
jgi:hypothetical protein